MTIEQRLAAVGFKLPNPPRPVGNYAAAQAANSLLFVSGQLPIGDCEARFRGVLGRDLDIQIGYEAARLAALNALSQIHAALGGFDRLTRIARVDGLLRTTPEFAEHARVLDGASDLLHAVLAERSGHARTAAGVASLPGGYCVELIVSAEIATE